MNSKERRAHGERTARNYNTIVHGPILHRSEGQCIRITSILKGTKERNLQEGKIPRFSLSLHRSFWTTRTGSDATKYRMQRPISAVAHMCTTVPPSSSLLESAYRPASPRTPTDTPWSRSARVFPASAPSKPQRFVASVPISRPTYIYIYSAKKLTRPTILLLCYLLAPP